MDGTHKNRSNSFVIHKMLSSHFSRYVLLVSSEHHQSYECPKHPPNPPLPCRISSDSYMYVSDSLDPGNGRHLAMIKKSTKYRSMMAKKSGSASLTFVQSESGVTFLFSTYITVHTLCWHQLPPPPPPAYTHASLDNLHHPPPTKSGYIHLWYAIFFCENIKKRS